MRKLIVLALLATVATPVLAQRPGREDGAGRWQERAEQRHSEGEARPVLVEQAPPVERAAPQRVEMPQQQPQSEGWRGRGGAEQRGNGGGGVRSGGQGSGFDPAAIARWQQRQAQQPGAVQQGAVQGVGQQGWVQPAPGTVAPGGGYRDRRGTVTREGNAGGAYDQRRYDGNRGGAYDQRRYDGNRRPAWNGVNNGGQWNGGQRYGGQWNGGGQRWSNDWRRDPRYDWQRYRQQNRSAFRVGNYYDPFGYGYRQLSIGFTLFSGYYQPNFWLDNPYEYRLPPVYGPYRWVRYYNDAVLVDIYSGEVVDVLRNFFW